jgi:hypothetical protein
MGAFHWSDSGLLLPTQGMDEAAVRRALTEHDPELVLLPPGVDVYGRPWPERQGYRVYRKVGGDKPIEFICFWGNDQFEPYPLSSALVDKVKELDRNTRSRQLDEYVREEQRRQEIEKQEQRDQEALASDWDRKHGVPVPHRGPALARGRRAMRREGWNV